MIDRKRKTSTDPSTTRQLRFEPLETRVQFAVDYLAFAPDLWVIEDSMTFEASELTDQWSIPPGTAMDAELDFGSDSEFHYGLDIAYGATPPVDSWALGSSVANGIAVSNPNIISDSPLDTSIFSVWDDGYYTDPFLAEPLEVVGTSIVPTSFNPTDLAWSDTTVGIAQPVYSVEPAFPESGQVVAIVTDFDSIDDSNTETAYIIVGLVPFDTSILPEMILPNGPGIEVFPGAQDNFDDILFSIGLGNGTVQPSLVTHTTAVGLTLIASALSDAVMLPWLVQSHSVTDVISNAGRSQVGMDPPGVGRVEAHLETGSQLPDESRGSSVRLVPAAQYVPLNAIAQQLPIDVDLGTQLPLDMPTPTERSSNARVKTPSSPIGIESDDAMSKLANVAPLKGLLPTGMLAIGSEPGSLAIRIPRSPLNNEHFVVQSLLICENLKNVEPADERLSSEEGEEEKEADLGLVNSALRTPSLSVVVVGCLFAMTQTAIKRHRLLDTHLAAWFARYS